MRAIKPVIAATVLGLSLTTTAACGPAGTDGKADAKGASQAAPTPLKTFTLEELSSLQKQKLEKYKNVRLKMTTSQAGEQVNVDMIMAMTGGKVEFDMTVSSPGGTGKLDKIHMIMAGKSFYMETPPGEKPPAPGKPWVDMSSGDSKNPMASIFQGMAKMFSSMADSENSMMGGFGGPTAGATITAAKEEVLNGQKSMHYTVSVNMEERVKSMDIKKLMDSMSGLMENSGAPSSRLPSADKLRAEMLKQFKGVVLTEEMWVDAEGLPIKATMTVPGEKGKPGTPMEMSYSGWGTSPVVPPPADQIGQMTADMFS